MKPFVFVTRPPASTFNVPSPKRPTYKSNELFHSDPIPATVAEPMPPEFPPTSLFVGRDGDGTLIVEAGGRVTNTFGYIGGNSGGMGSATVAGIGSEWNNSFDLYVGRFGDGTLNVDAGGLVTNTNGFIGVNSGSTGTLTVSGAGSHWNNSSDLTVGGSGVGTLNVEAGGLVTNTIGFIGVNSGGTGTVTVTGAGSQWNNSDILLVGTDGIGTLNVEAGGVVNSDDGYIGYFSDSSGTATVTGTGSQWNNSAGLYVCRAGNGTLNVEAGGLVTNTFGIIGNLTGYTGNATVTGTGSQWNNSSVLYVGLFGDATMDVEAEGVVANVGGFIGWNLGSTGTATVTGAGSKWNNTADLYVGGTETTAGGTGTLNILNEGLVSVGGTLKVWDDGIVNLASGTLDVGTLDLTAATATDDFNMTGGFLIADTIIGSIVQDGGTLAPGESPGLTSIDGDYLMNAGSIEFELGGLLRGLEYDVLDVTGMSLLTGTMDINLISGFDPFLGDSFVLIDSVGGYGGTPLFDFNDASLASGLSWNSSTFLTDGRISVVSSVPEPGSLTVLGWAAAGIFVRRHRRTKINS